MAPASRFICHYYYRTLINYSDHRPEIKTSELTSPNFRHCVKVKPFPVTCHAYLLQLPGLCSEIQHEAQAMGPRPANSHTGDVKPIQSTQAQWTYCSRPITSNSLQSPTLFLIQLNTQPPQILLRKKGMSRSDCFCNKKNIYMNPKECAQSNRQNSLKSNSNLCSSQPPLRCLIILHRKSCANGLHIKIWLHWELRPAPPTQGSPNPELLT